MAANQRAYLRAYLLRQHSVDAKMRKVLIDAANDARRLIRQMEMAGSRNEVRIAQLRLQEQQLRLWARVENVITDGMSDVPGDVVKVDKAWSRDLLRSLGISPDDSFVHSLEAQARRTIESYISRQQHGLTLSERVYKNASLASGRIDKIIDNALLQGRGPAELAREVARFINPNVRGGVSYAAMRLGRTEVNNAFHLTAQRTAQANPLVSKMAWSLSRSHPKADICDSLVGNYAKDNVPMKPHPQCFCYISPVPMAQSTLIAMFKAGKLDSLAS